MRYDPSQAERTAQPGEKIVLRYGTSLGGFGSGDVFNTYNILDNTGEKRVDLPNGTRLRRLGRHYTVVKENNPDSHPDAEFPEAIIQDPFPEFMYLEDKSGRRVSHFNRHKRTKFIVVSIPSREQPSQLEIVY